MLVKDLLGSEPLQVLGACHTASQGGCDGFELWSDLAIMLQPSQKHSSLLAFLARFPTLLQRFPGILNVRIPLTSSLTEPIVLFIFIGLTVM